MFMVRRLLSAGLRTTLPQLQENVKSVQSLATPLLSIEPTVSNTSRKASKLVTVTLKQPKSQKKRRGKVESIAVTNDVDLDLTADLTIIDRKEIETKLSTEQDVDGRDQLEVTYTCPRCDTINQKTIGKWGYEESSVMVLCDGCDDNQILAARDGTYHLSENDLDPIRVMILMHKKYPQNTPKEFQDDVDLYYKKSQRVM